MLTKRIIPTILCKGKTAYKGRQFSADRSIGSVVSLVQVHARRGVDELVILDVAATAENRGPDLDMIREITAGCFIPVTVGGGVKTLDDIDRLLRAGADKVCVGEAKLTTVVLDAAKRFGSQAIVVSIDVQAYHAHGYIVQMARALEADGAGEILLQSIDRDGMMNGYDLDLVRAVSSAVGIPVVASGGCSGYQNMLDAIHAGADAVAAGALFSFTDCTPRGAAKFLKANGVAVRA